jgi:UDP-glucose 4-epimerase
MGNVLVLGHRGYLGQALCVRLAEKHEVFGVRDRFGSSVKSSTIPENLETIYHLAADTDAYRVQATPVRDLRRVPQGTLALLQEVAQLDPKPNIVYASTVTIFGMNSTIIDKGTRDSPITIYDAHKLLIENYLNSYRDNVGLPSVSVRLSNVYGPSPGDPGPNRGYVNTCVSNAVLGKPIVVFGDGSELRDYIYIDDVIEFLILCGEGKYNNPFYIFASGLSHSISDLANKISTMVGDVEVRYIEPSSQLAIEKRTHQFEVGRAYTSLDEGLRKTIKYYQDKYA